VKQVTVIADDKVGLLADISYILGKAKVNIDSINADVVGGKAIVCLSLSDVEKGKSVLETSGFKVGELNSVVVRVKDQPGELNKITSVLSKEGVNIENVHMLSRDDKSTIISITVDKPKKAAGVLRDSLLSSDDIY